ncbi:MAG: hypothetical protein CL760_11725 [Chloroflexi bacterium]|nr:hypothetical protein [Chloroflexota bacterium]|tara:strand:+ start:81027 stop:81557 length:531 start_codon:yes stop_codon:yes gene_type:complete
MSVHAEKLNTFLRKYLQESVEQLDFLQKEVIETQKSIAKNILMETERLDFTNEMSIDNNQNGYLINYHESVYQTCVELYTALKNQEAHFVAHADLNIKRFLRIRSNFEPDSEQRNQLLKFKEDIFKREKSLNKINPFYSKNKEDLKTLDNLIAKNDLMYEKYSELLSDLETLRSLY